MENFPHEEWKVHKNHCTPVILESKKQAKKVVAEPEGYGLEVPIEHLGSTHFPPYSVKNMQNLLLIVETNFPHG